MIEKIAITDNKVIFKNSEEEKLLRRLYQPNQIASLTWFSADLYVHFLSPCHIALWVIPFLHRLRLKRTSLVGWKGRMRGFEVKRDGCGSGEKGSKDGTAAIRWYGRGFLNADNYRIVKGYSRIIIRFVGSPRTGQLSEIDLPKTTGSVKKYAVTGIGNYRDRYLRR